MSNNHGGARKGSGRKPKPKEPIAGESGSDPLDFLQRIMQDENADPTLRVRAAITVAQYKHTKLADGGKKLNAQDAADKAADGKFTPRRAPLKLVGNG